MALLPSPISRSCFDAIHPIPVAFQVPSSAGGRFCAAAFLLAGVNWLTPPSTPMRRENLNSLFRDFDRFPRGPAIVYSHGYRHSSWTYERLASTALLFANALKSRGIRTNDRILLWAPNSAEWVAAFWGCLLSGAVAVPMDDSASPEFACRVARDSQVRLIVASRSQPQLDPAIPLLVVEDLAGMASNHRVFVSQTVPRETPKPSFEIIASEPLT